MFRSAALLCGLLLLAARSNADLEYSIEPEVASRTLRVSLRLEAKANQEFRIPAWCPGFYFLLRYQDKISDFRATDSAGNILKFDRSDPRAWTVRNSEGPIRVSYRILGDDGGLGFFNVSVRSHAAFVNGPAAFMFPVGRLTEKVKLKLTLPAKWEVATTLERDGAEYSASGYDELIDHPIQLGLFERRSFKVNDIPFEAVFVSPNRVYKPDLTAEAERFRRLSKPAIDIFGAAPFKRYLYIIHLDPGSFDGGLEHRSSTVINTANSDPLMIDELAAHEYFHSWNVKQIRPKVLGPFDYTKEVRTGNLWFAEGVTDYYGHLTTYQSGLQGEEWLLENFSFQIGNLQASKVRLRKTLEAVSKGTWETGGFGDDDLSYYTKGLVCGLLFDAKIRAVTNGKKSLDDVMRVLYARHRLPKPGYDEDDLMKSISEVAGTDLAGLYNRMIRSTEELPYDLLPAIGLRLRMPGKPDRSLPFVIKDGAVIDASPTMLNAGLRPNDNVISINGAPMVPGCFSAMKPGDLVQLIIDRGGEKLEFRATIAFESPGGYQLERDPFATADAEKLCREWLSSRP